jgi:hypothetical protein
MYFTKKLFYYSLLKIAILAYCLPTSLNYYVGGFVSFKANSLRLETERNKKTEVKIHNTKTGCTEI